MFLAARNFEDTVSPLWRKCESVASFRAGASTIGVVRPYLLSCLIVLHAEIFVYNFANLIQVTLNVEISE